MSAPVEAFWIQPVDAVRRSLRRFAHSDPRAGRSCPGPWGYHNALADLDVVDVPRSGPLSIRDGADVVPHDDPRWPAKCDGCGRPFGDDKNLEPHQLFLSRLYERPDTLERYTLDAAPPGAMYDAEWYHDEAGTMMGPEGLSLNVKLPDGSWWCVDGRSSTGGRWTRTGTVPKITATPSILTPRWHGWLRDGLLVGA